MINLIGIDFSLVKPAATVYSENKYLFFAWPSSLNQKYIELYKNSGVTIISRDMNKEDKDLSIKMRSEIQNSEYLSNLIIDTLKEFINKNTYIAIEGLSYGSKGDVILQLSSYKHLLMYKLSKILPLENLFTYSPMTIKSIAGCAKKGMNKKNLISEFIINGPVSKFRLSLYEKRYLFMKRGGNNWIDLVDDLVDSYFTLKTLRLKEGLIENS